MRVLSHDLLLVIGCLRFGLVGLWLLWKTSGAGHFDGIMLVDFDGPASVDRAGPKSDFEQPTQIEGRWLCWSSVTNHMEYDFFFFCKN